MYPVKNIKYLNLPPIPKEITDSIILDEKNVEEAFGTRGYSMITAGVDRVNEWGRENISEDIFLAYQLITRGVDADDYVATGIIHKDNSSLTKLLYLVEPGGDNVYTSFYSDQAGTDLLFKTVIQPHRWAILEVSQWHHTQNIEPGKMRFSIAGQVFRDQQQDIREDYSHLPPHSIYNNN